MGRTLPLGGGGGGSSPLNRSLLALADKLLPKLERLFQVFTPRETGRTSQQMARNIIGSSDFREVYISTPLAECERRDVKGLYARARRGEVKDFTGISAPFEAPEHPDLSLDTSRMTLEEEVTAVVELISKRLRPEQQEDTREI